MHFRKLLSGMTMLLLVSTVAFAGEVVRSVSHGTYELPLLLNPDGSVNLNPQVGELITCAGLSVPPPGQHLLRVTSIYDRFEGVCDDLGAPPCADRLVIVQESCLETGDGNPGASGLIEAAYNKGAVARICWDPSGAGQCTAEYEVAQSVGIGAQTRNLIGAPTGETIALSRITSSRYFKVDGRSVRISQDTAKSDSLFERHDPQAGQSDCILPPPYPRPGDACGVATFSTRVSNDGQNQQ